MLLMIFAVPAQIGSLRSRFVSLGVRKLALHLPETIAASDGSIQCLIGHETGEAESGQVYVEGSARGCVHPGYRIKATT